MKIIMRVLGKPGRQYDEIEFDTDSLPFTYEAENGKVRISHASKLVESPGTVPAVAAANSQSDEIKPCGWQHSCGYVRVNKVCKGPTCNIYDPV